MTNEYSTLVKGLETWLKKLTLSQAITVERKYKPVKVETTDTPHITVFSGSVAIEWESRAGRQKTYQIGIGLQKELTTSGPDEPEALIDLLQEIEDLLIGRTTGPRIDGFSLQSIGSQGDGSRPLYTAEVKDELSQFGAAIHANFVTVS